VWEKRVAVADTKRFLSLGSKEDKELELLHDKERVLKRPKNDSHARYVYVSSELLFYTDIFTVESASSFIRAAIIKSQIEHQLAQLKERDHS
jgi:hypothetical protein